MAREPYNVLVLSAGNSVRSILAESLGNRHGGRRFHFYSAGCHPKGEIHPMALEVLREHGHETSGLRSKIWDEFRRPGAPPFDFVITVCDLEAGEACPTWWGQVSAHWGVEDPDRLGGDPAQQRRFFHRVYAELESRIKLFTAFRDKELDALRLRPRLHQIDEPAPESAEPGAPRG
jgi:arsenate reductase